jgi:signal transduction histidine kinase
LPEYEYKVTNSDTIKLYFSLIEPHFESVYGSALTIKFLGKETTSHNYNEVKQLRKHILDNEFEFLQLMDKIVYQLSKESEEKVKMLELYEKILMFLTLFVLLFEGFFVFKPAVSQIRKYIVELVNTKDILQQTNQELIQTNDVLKHTQDELKLAEKEKYQRKFEEQMIRSASLIKGQEDERRRLSKELHDGLGQLLTALKFDLEKLDVDKNDIAKNKAIISEAKNIVAQTIKETRNIAFNLMPSILNDFGLIPTITLIGEQIKAKYSIEVLFNSNIMDEARYNQEIEIALYRIIQEATNNVVKHADATRIYVDLFENDLELNLKISDNGKGFQIKNVKKNKENHSGLNNMEERVKLLDGTFIITSKKGDGVLIEIKIPIKI